MYQPCCYNQGIEAMGVTFTFNKSHNFWNFSIFSLGYIEEKGCFFWSFVSIFMKSHTMIEKTLLEHIIIVILHFWAKNVVFNKNNCIPQNCRSFTKSTVMGSGNILWTCELDQIIFLDFTGIESSKYKEIRVSGAKLFLRSIYFNSIDL